MLKWQIFFSLQEEATPKYKILQSSLLELSVSRTEIYAIKIIPQTIVFSQACIYRKMKGNGEISKLAEALLGHIYCAS